MLISDIDSKAFKRVSFVGRHYGCRRYDETILVTRLFFCAPWNEERGRFKLLQVASLFSRPWLPFCPNSRCPVHARQATSVHFRMSFLFSLWSLHPPFSSSYEIGVIKLSRHGTDIDDSYATGR